MKHNLITIIYIYISINISYSQTLNWEKSYGGTSDDLGHSVIKLNNEYWTVSTSISFDYDVMNINGSPDAWVMGLDSSGAILKSKCYGGINTENGQKIISTYDNCLVIAGYAESNDGDLAGSSWNGGRDFWIFKIDTAMNLIWSKCLGGSNEDIANSIVQTPDSGFLVVGESKSLNWDVPGHYGTTMFSDIFLAKIDKNGVYQWGKDFGGSYEDVGIDVVATDDGGSLLLGTSNSIDNDMSFSHLGQIVVFKLDSIGGIQWINTYGGSISEDAHKLLLNPDGSFYVAGTTLSDDGQVTNHVGYIDGWVLKINATGNLIWQKCIGSGGREEAVSMCKTVSGNLMVGFYNYATDSLFQPYDAALYNDVFMALLDTNGNYISGNHFGGSLIDNAYDVIPIGFNRNLFIGETMSHDYDVSFLHNINYFDVWIGEISDGGTVSINNLDETLKDIRASIINDQLNLNLFCEKKQRLKLNIYDNSGRAMFSKEMEVNFGLNYFNFPLFISTGIYFLSITGTDGVNTQIKLVAINK